jgi:plasmid stabilization system protein ParE
MVKRIIWSANALSDRIQILDYWYQRIGNKNYSRKLDNSLKDLLRHLTRFPEMGRKLYNRNERLRLLRKVCLPPKSPKGTF